MFKILIIGPKSPPYGGIQRFGEQLLKLEGGEFGLRYFADNIPPNWRPSTRTSQFTWNIFKRDGLFISLKCLVFVGFKYLIFLKELLFYRPNIVHILSSNNLGYYRNCIYALLSRIFFIKIIFHHLGQVDDMLKGSKGLNNYLMRKFLNLPHLHITQSDGLSKFLKNYTNLNVYTIYNPIDDDTFQLGSNLVRNYAFNSRRFLVVGYLGYSKGTYDILDALEQLKVEMTNSNSKVIFVGGGDIDLFKKIAFDKGLNSFIEFKGELSDDLKLDLLRNYADIFLLPSRAEGQPIAVLEAMCMSLPVIVGNVGSLPEIVTDKIGFLVNPGDLNSLIYAIKNCISLDSDLSLMSLNSRKWIAKRHSWKDFDITIKSIYKNCA